MAQNKLWLSDDDYKTVFSKVPRVCVDLVVRKGKEILFSLRNINPYKGNWHLPGGTLYKGETIQESSVRIAKNETNLNVDFVRILGVADVINEDRQTHNQHVICIFVEVKILSGSASPDFQSSKLDFFSAIPDNIVNHHQNIFKLIN